MNIDNTYLDNVKAKLTINDNIIKGYAVVFDSVDLQNEYFTKNTFLGVEENSKTILMYNHGLDETLKRVPIGTTIKYAIDDYGLSFEAELKALREEATATEALPSNSKRSMNSNRNSVEYWIAKGEMPPANEPKLRQDYVNARIAKTKERHMFSDNPIA